MNDIEPKNNNKRMISDRENSAQGHLANDPPVHPLLLV